jgi:hypothetical protein
VYRATADTSDGESDAESGGAVAGLEHDQADTEQR